MKTLLFKRLWMVLILVVLAPRFAEAEESPMHGRIIPVPVVVKSPDRLRIQARDAHLAYEWQAMSTLTSWAVASIATGTMLWATGGDRYTQAVGIQNVAWGAIDGVIAGFGYRGIRKQSVLDKPVSYWTARDRKTRKIFLINAGLDVLYIAGGAALMGLGKSDFVKGSGAGVILQGSFLLLFDGAMGVAIR
ncbi:MAG TPA: hypothetical protein PK156_12980 [Polyangium sp.]|nr:hypothetical protein [Polyangium sp.]